ncbi:MAG TPA: response regulator [Actinomycetota bacterium]|jgi:DNA-binding response OmpR family regulator|nr:response regulator [Actinomycetota bacterium]
MSASGSRVILADDDQILSRLVELNLRVAGIEMEAVHRGDDALRLIRASPPDALILDATMPGMDGPEVYRRLREDAGLVDLPVIFLTGRSAEEFRDYRDDHLRVLTKPFDPEQLVELVRQAIEAPA